MVGVSIAALDFTARKQSEEKLQQHERHSASEKPACGYCKRVQECIGGWRLLRQVSSANLSRFRQDSWQ